MCAECEQSATLKSRRFYKKPSLHTHLDVREQKGKLKVIDDVGVQRM